MTIDEALKFGIALIAKDKKHLSPVLDSEVLLSFALKKDKSFLFANPAKKISKIQETAFRRLVKARVKNIPVAYLTGHKEFCGLDFLVNKNALIPRPDTETLVDRTISELKGERGLTIVDVGTGSGCIIISLAKKVPHNLYFGLDVSKQALMVAKKNARRHKAAIAFKQSDLLKGLQNQKLDIIIANLPYGWKAWKNNTTAETAGLKHEPQIALFTEEKGLLLIRRLLEQVAARQEQPRMIALEFDPRQAKDIKKLAEKILPGFSADFFKDLAGRNRFVLLRKSS